MLRALFTSALCLTALPAFARENYALLIGANQYPSLEERWWLKGPANDVQLVATYLTTEAPVPFPADSASSFPFSPGPPSPSESTLFSWRLIPIPIKPGPTAPTLGR